MTFRRHSRSRRPAHLKVARHQRYGLLGRLPLIVLAAGTAAAAVGGSVFAGGALDAGSAPVAGSHGSASVVDLSPAPKHPLKWVATKPINPSTLSVHLTSASASTSAPQAVPATSMKPTLPAPSGFANQLVQMYSSAAAVANASGSLSSMPPSSEFAQSLTSLTSTQLSEVYDALQKAPGGFSGLKADFEQITTSTSAPATPSNPSDKVAVGGAASAQGPSAGSVQSQASGTGITFPTTPTTTQTTDAAGNAANCTTNAPGGNYGEDAIYAATLAVDVATTADAVVPQALALGAYVLGEGSTFTIPDPVNIVVQAVIMAAAIARDTLIWENDIYNTCTAGAQEEQIGIIFDNVDTLVTLVDSRTTAIDNEEQLLYALVEERDTLILNKIGAIQASLNLELTFTIEEDLLQGSNGAVADFEVPTSDGGYLNAVPIGVQEIVTTALADEQHAGQPVNPAAPGELAAANAALAAGNYKQAFDDYGTTYTEIVG